MSLESSYWNTWYVIKSERLLKQLDNDLLHETWVDKNGYILLWWLLYKNKKV